MGEERRRSFRQNANFSASYKIVDTQYEHEHTVKNVSQTGVCLKTHTVMEVSSLLEVEMEVSSEHDLVKFLGIVMWSRPVGVLGEGVDEPYAETGLRILSIDPEHQKLISRFLKQQSLPPQEG